MIKLDSVQDTSLWKKLKNDFKGKPYETLASQLASGLIGICDEAASRMKAMPSLHPEYTFHDEVHLLRVTELMDRIMPTHVKDLLNPVEIFLLIASAHLHDQGMVLDREEFDAMKRAPSFDLQKKNWEVDHPNLREAREKLGEVGIDPKEKARCEEIVRELDNAMLSYSIRKGHGGRSKEFVKKQYGSDKRFEVLKVNLAGIVADLCDSHDQDSESVREFLVDREVGDLKVNLRYLALVLRLADVLDFDRERAPETIHRTIHFTNDVSVTEWEKHRAVEGWTTQSGQRVRFTMACEHPVYQRAAYQFMDYIDRELAAADGICREFPHVHCGYFFDFRMPVDRDRIAPKDNKYIYHDLEFSLSRDELVKLLMTEKLYQRPSLAVREILQNALDALRHRKAVFKRDTGADWNDGKVEFVHYVNEDGYEVLKCTDNGIGMDKNIIENFLTRVGRSYYRSPEFEQERETFRAKGIDYDPCSQFGIGFMSYFMLGDRIIIKTRRDRGPNRGQGDSLEVEINGYGGILVIRKLDFDIPTGTSVEIIIRKKPDFFDRYTDKIRLISTLRKFALATEYPIKAECLIDEIEEKVNFSTDIPIIPTLFQRYGVKDVIHYERNLSEVNPNLKGYVKLGFLTDEMDRLASKNSEAECLNDEKILIPSQGVSDIESDKAIFSIDGIYITGNLHLLHLDPDSINYSHFRLAYCFIDIRGDIKPEVTAARSKPQSRYFYDELPGWKNIHDILTSEIAKIWEDIAVRSDKEETWDIFWDLADSYRAPLEKCNADIIWKHVRVPVASNDNNQVSWIKISELELKKYQEIDLFCFQNGKNVSRPFLVAVDELSRLSPLRVLNASGELPSMEEIRSKMPTVYELKHPISQTIARFSLWTLHNSTVCRQIIKPGECFVNKVTIRRTSVDKFSGPLSDFFAILHFIAGHKRLVINESYIDVNLIRMTIDIGKQVAITRYLDYLLNAMRQLPEFFRQDITTEFKDILKNTHKLYSLINWLDYPRLAPPYKIYDEQKTYIVTSQDIENWGKGTITITNSDPLTE